MSDLKNEINNNLYKTLKKVFDLTAGAFDDPVITDVLYDEMETVLAEYEANGLPNNHEKALPIRDVINCPNCGGTAIQKSMIKRWTHFCDDCGKYFNLGCL